MAADQPTGDDLDKRGLPPIHRIKMPSMQVTSTKIRWLAGVGYLPKEIAPFLGVRYQQVRNVLTQPPKRAAREDLPPLVVEILDLTDDNLELMDQHAMEISMAAQRAEHLDSRKATNAARRRLRDVEGNSDLDDENYMGDESAT